MAKKRKRPQKPKARTPYVLNSKRQVFEDARTKRDRSRSDNRRNAIREASDD